MKFRVTIKDPDVFSDAIRDAVRQELAESELPADERDALEDIRCTKTEAAIAKFVEYGEYIVVEFDTDAGTATVVPRS